MNTSHNKNRVVDHGWKNVFKNLIRRSNNDSPGTEQSQNKNSNTVVQEFNKAEVEEGDDKNDIFTMTEFHSVTAECGSAIDDGDCRLNCPSEDDNPYTSTGQNREKSKKSEYLNLDVSKLSAKQKDIYPTAH